MDMKLVHLVVVATLWKIENKTEELLKTAFFSLGQESSFYSPLVFFLFRRPWEIIGVFSASAE